MTPIDPEDIRVLKSRTDGFWTSIALLDSGATLAIFLDRFSGHDEPRFWFGFDIPSHEELNALVSLAPEAGFEKAPVVRTQKDMVEPDEFFRYRDPLTHEEFDTLIEERPDSEFFLGIHYPRPWPLSRNALLEVAGQVVQFGTRFACAIDAREKRASPWGRPDANVERAAIEHVSSLLKKEGYRVRSREAELCGYDLLAMRGDGELHVEVKGSAEGERFFLTRNEWATAERDPAWRLFVVTDALAAPRLFQYTRSEVERRFRFEPTQWFVYHPER